METPTRPNPILTHELYDAFQRVELDRLASPFVAGEVGLLQDATDQGAGDAMGLPDLGQAAPLTLGRG
jgi:hypothetical protein